MVCFLLGILVGITSFARVLSWLLKNRPGLTYSGLVGLMLGALRSVWPFWDTETRWPALPQQWGLTEIQSLGAMLLGMILVAILLYVGQRAEKRVNTHGELS